MLATAPGCLVTSDPEFTGPSRTAPVLLESSQRPLGEVVRFEWLGTNQIYSPELFTANVVSEDVGQPVKVALLLDYGVRNPVSKKPWRDANPGDATAPATLADGSRPLESVFNVEPLTDFSASATTVGCHRLTLVASHDFISDTTFCPKDPLDVSRLSWTVSFCERMEGGACPLEPCPENEVDCDDLGMDEPAAGGEGGGP